MKFTEWSKEYTRQIRVRTKAYELLRDYAKKEDRKMYNVASAIIIYELEKREKKAKKSKNVKKLMNDVNL